MSPGKTLSLGILAWCVLGTVVHADPINSISASDQWTFWSQSSNSTIGAPTYTAASAPSIPPPVPSPPPTIQYTPTPTVASQPPVSASSGTPDAFINFGNGTYAGATTMTAGTIQPWYESPSVTQAFGGVPNSQQQADFASTVLSHVEQTFQNSGINVNLTLDPNAQAAHTLSVVSGASYGLNPNAIGIAEVGGSGYSFIDKLSYANSVDQLAWADAHNIAHELMHAFGVATHHDQTGQYLDAATANWNMLTSPNTSFSADASADIRAHLAAKDSGSGGVVGAETLGGSGCHCPLCQEGYLLSRPVAMELGAAPVPEPATFVLWAVAGSVVTVLRARQRRANEE